jgi:hypothetical protein
MSSTIEQIKTIIYAPTHENNPSWKRYMESSLPFAEFAFLTNTLKTATLAEDEHLFTPLKGAQPEDFLDEKDDFFIPKADLLASEFVEAYFMALDSEQRALTLMKAMKFEDGEIVLADSLRAHLRVTIIKMAQNLLGSTDISESFQEKLDKQMEKTIANIAEALNQDPDLSQSLANSISEQEAVVLNLQQVIYGMQVGFFSPAIMEVKKQVQNLERLIQEVEEESQEETNIPLLRQFFSLLYKNQVLLRMMNEPALQKAFQYHLSAMNFGPTSKYN